LTHPRVLHLCVVQKRGSLLIRWNNSTLTSETDFLAKDTWYGDDKGRKEENTHDDKGKDPLECKGLCEELSDTEGGSEDAERESHGVILVCNQEETSIDQDTPDGDVRYYASCQVMGIDGDGAIPVQSNECPCKRPTCGWDVDESRMCVVAEIEGRQVEEIDDQNHLSPDEVSANKQHDKGKLQEVVKDEVTSDTSGSLNIVIVIREEVPHVTDLEEEEGEPVERSD